MGEAALVCLESDRSGWTCSVAESCGMTTHAGLIQNKMFKAAHEHLWVWAVCQPVLCGGHSREQAGVPASWPSGSRTPGQPRAWPEMRAPWPCRLIPSVCLRACCNPGPLPPHPWDRPVLLPAPGVCLVHARPRRSGLCTLSLCLHACPTGCVALPLTARPCLNAPPGDLL